MKKRSKAGTLLQMLKLVEPLKKHMVLAVCCGSLAYLAVQFIPILGGYAILSGLGQSAFPLGLIWTLLIFFALIRAVLRYIEQKTNHYIAFTLLAIIRDHVFQALRRLSPAKLEGRDKGDLINLITSDVELLEVFYAHTISPICIAIVVELVMTVFISLYHYEMGMLAFFGYLCVGILLPLIISKHTKDTGDQIRHQAGDLASYVLENIRGIDETAQYQNGSERMQGMNEKTDRLIQNQGKLSHLTGFNLALTNTFILVFDIGMLLVATSLYNKGEVGLSGFVIPVIAMMSSFGPVVALANLGTTLQSTIASASRVLDILEETPETEDIVGKETKAFEGAECQNVTFSYGGQEVLSNYSMTFEKNKITGIVGKSGCGKSTLLKLLMRFWEVNNGSIQISDTDIRNINTANLRDMESYMTQETQLFKDTIANNIRIAKLDATDQEIEEACKKAAIHDFIQTLPQGYQTQVGELGDTLSGGEKQRIGLARAFLHDAPFVLLDEPTSNLDSLNEAIILKSLQAQSKGKTVVLVSHRKSTVRIADTVHEM